MSNLRRNGGARRREWSLLGAVLGSVDNGVKIWGPQLASWWSQRMYVPRQNLLIVVLIAGLFCGVGLALLLVLFGAGL